MELFGVDLAAINYKIYLGVIVVLGLIVLYIAYTMYFGESSGESFGGSSGSSKAASKKEREKELTEIIEKINDKQAKHKNKG